MPSVLNQILNQPSSRAGSPDVLAMAAAAAAVAQAKTELKKDVCICLFCLFLFFLLFFSFFFEGFYLMQNYLS